MSMMTSSNGNIFRVTGPLCGEFIGPVKSPHKDQWRGALFYSLFCARINGWVNNREAGDLRRHCTHYDVIIMQGILHCHLDPSARTSAKSNATTLLKKERENSICKMAVFCFNRNMLPVPTFLQRQLDISVKNIHSNGVIIVAAGPGLCVRVLFSPCERACNLVSL